MADKRDLRIVFMGTPEFAVASLKALVENQYQIVGVITSPDKPAGRGYKLKASAVKQYAEEVGLKVLQPKNLKEETFLTELKALNANLQIVVAFRMLPEAVWSMPEYGTFNLHGSLLPKYRGAAPINWAVINGENETGVTTFFLQHEIDTGDIIDSRTLEIKDSWTAGHVHDELMEIGAGLVLDTVRQIELGQARSKPQEDGEVCHAPKLNRENTRIDWSKTRIEVRNFIRGLAPFPGAWTEVVVQGKPLRLKVLFAELTSEKIATRTLVQRESKLLVGCKDGALELTIVQLEGKKVMSASDLLNGTQFETQKL